MFKAKRARGFQLNNDRVVHDQIRNVFTHNLAIEVDLNWFLGRNHQT